MKMKPSPQTQRVLLLLPLSRPLVQTSTSACQPIHSGSTSKRPRHGFMALISGVLSTSAFSISTSHTHTHTHTHTHSTRRALSHTIKSGLAGRAEPPQGFVCVCVRMRLCVCVCV